VSSNLHEPLMPGLGGESRDGGGKKGKGKKEVRSTSPCVWMVCGGVGEGKKKYGGKGLCFWWENKGPHFFLFFCFFFFLCVSPGSFSFVFSCLILCLVVVFV